MDTAVFCGICDNYGIYGDTVGLQCISNLFLVIFTPFRGFSAKIWMFWTEYDILGCLLNSKFFTCSFGMAPSQLKMFHLSTSLPMMCTWSMRVLNAAGNAFSERQLQVVHLVHHSPFGRRP